MLFIDLINNLALLVALSVVSGFIGRQWKFRRREAVLQGLLFGTVAVIGMLRPLVIAQGLIFDGRSVVISLCGLFFGPVAVTIAGGMAVVLRIMQGGVGAFMGVPVILASALIGYIFYLVRIKRQEAPFSSWHFLLFGFIVHAVMLLLTLTLPWEVTVSTLRKIGVPVITLYPLATVLIGRILLDHDVRNRSLRNEARWQFALEGPGDGVWDWDAQDNTVYFSHQWKAMLGYSDADIGNRFEDWSSRVHPDDLAQCREALERYFRGETTMYQTEHRMRCKDGSYKWVLDRGTVIEWGSNGKPRRVIGTHTDISDRKRIQEQIAASENKFSLVFHTTPLPVAIAELDTAVFIDVNDAFLALNGFTRDEVVGRSSIDLGLWCDRADRDHIKEQLRTTNGIDNVPVRMRGKSGEVMDMVFWARIVTINGRRCLLTISQDVTERKKAEEELRKVSTELQQIFTNMINAFVIWESVFDANGVCCSFRFGYFNEAYARMGQLKLEEVQGKDVFDVWPSNERSWITVFGDVAVTGVPKTFDMYHEPTKRWYHCNAYRPSDSPAQVCGIFEDITERKKADDALRESEDQIRLLLNSTAEAIYGIDLNGNCIFCNNACLRQLGYAHSGELLGKNMHEQIHSKRADGTPFDARECRIFQAFKNGEYAHVDDEVLWRADGTCFPAEYWSYPRIRDGKILGAVVTFLDITERKQAEEAVQAWKQRYDLIVAASGMVAYEYIVATGELIWGAGMSNVLGYAQDEIVGGITQWESWLHPEDKERTLAYLAETLHKCTYWDVEYRIRHKDGSYVWARDRGYFIAGSDGRAERQLGLVEDISSRKLAEQRIAVSEKKFSTVFHSIPLPVAITDIDTGVFVEVNDFFPTVIGFSREELLGHSSADLNMWVDITERQRIADQLRATGRLDDFAARMRIKNGDIRDVLFFARIIEIGGKPHILTLSHDITEQKRSEIALRESEERYKNMFENNHAVMLLVDPDTSEVIDANPAACAYYGWERKVFLKMTMTSINTLTPEELQQEMTMARTEKRYHFFFKHRRADGSIRDVEVYSGPVVLRGRTVLYSIVHDITDRKRAEESLRREQHFSKTILDSLPGIFYLYSYPELRLVLWNKNHETLLGFTAEEMKNRDIFSWHPPQAREPVRQAVEAVMEKGVNVIEGPLLKKDGGTIPFLMTGIRFEADGTLYLAGIGIDITDKKKAEQQLQQKNEELERFTYTVSHDLKSPLVTIKTFLGYLEKDMQAEDAENTRKDIDFMKTAAMTMGVLLEELLELSRIGRKVNPSEWTSLRELTRDAIARVAGRIAERKIEVRVKDEALALYGDRVRLVEVFQNLIDNAAKFMGDQKEPRIEIGREERDGKTVVFVRDNGIGIDPRYQKKLFGLFEKLDASAEGAGMGLAIIKRIIEHHGGTIWVESEGHDKGTTFYFAIAQMQAL